MLRAGGRRHGDCARDHAGRAGAGRRGPAAGQRPPRVAGGLARARPAAAGAGGQPGADARRAAALAQPHAAALLLLCRSRRCVKGKCSGAHPQSCRCCSHRPCPRQGRRRYHCELREVGHPHASPAPPCLTATCGSIAARLCCQHRASMPQVQQPEPTGWQFNCKTMTAECDKCGEQPAYGECPAHLHRKRATGLAAQVRRALAAGRLFAALVTFRCHRFAVYLPPRGLGVVALGACLPQAA